jgi:hypothetical protein
MDETWVNQNHCTDYMLLPNDGSEAPKIPSGKGKRLIVLHAGTRSEGLILGSFFALFFHIILFWYQ